tara:strand:+ start:8494 stop:8907 length:414 start_codon:yes stop_codon:yes gene_type:complete
MKAYCQKCGHGTSYTSQKPKFCSFCGDSFSGDLARVSKAAATNIATPAKTTVDKPKLEYELSTEDSGSDFEGMEGLAYEVERSSARKITFEQIAGTSDPSTPIVDRPKAYTRKRVSKKQVLEDFKREAGQSRESESI